MKRLTIFAFLGFLAISFTLQGQNIHTKEIKETLSNGFTVFNIITDNIKMKFKEDLEYSWYNEFSGQQYSTGAAGGNLLHGKYSIFDETGRLTGQGYYKFGLSDSVWFLWDNYGRIINKYIYKNGIQRFWWFTNEKYIFEVYSSSKEPDYKRSVYTLDNKLVSQEKCISANPIIWEVQDYYENSKRLRAHYYLFLFGNKYYGQYEDFFENGSINRSGNYDKKYKLGLKVGLWLVFNESSNQIDTLKYKLSETILNSVGEKEVGSLVYSPEFKDWIKYGYWYHIDNKGSVIDEPKMESDPSEKNNQIKAATIISETPSNTIKIIKTPSGLIEVPVVLNDVLRINFIFDSGASEVSISPDVALTLIRTGTITEKDFLLDQTYTFADGSTAKSKRFLIRKLIIGNQTLTNIEASISKSIEAPMLIGQNVMQKLGSVTIDYDKMLLIIKSK